MAWPTVLITIYLTTLAGALIADLSNWTSVWGAVKEYQTLLAGGFAVFSVFYLATQIKDERDRHLASVRLTLRGELDAISLGLKLCDLNRLDRPTLRASMFNTHPKMLARISDDEMAYLQSRIDFGSSRHFEALSHSISEHNDYLDQPEVRLYPDLASQRISELRTAAEENAETMRYILQRRQTELQAIAS